MSEENQAKPLSEEDFAKIMAMLGTQMRGCLVEEDFGAEILRALTEPFENIEEEAPLETVLRAFCRLKLQEANLHLCMRQEMGIAREFREFLVHIVEETTLINFYKNGLVNKDTMVGIFPRCDVDRVITLAETAIAIPREGAPIKDQVSQAIQDLQEYAEHKAQSQD